MTKRTPSKKDPTFVDQLREIGMSEHSIPDITFSYADHQYMTRLMNVRDIAIQDDLKEYLQAIYEKDNECLCKAVSTYVCKEVAETIEPIWGKLEELCIGQKDIVTAIEKMDGRMKAIEDRVFVTDENRLQKLEKYASKGQTILRGAVYITIAVILAMTMIMSILNNKISHIEDLLQEHVKIEQIK